MTDTTTTELGDDSPGAIRVTHYPQVPATSAFVVPVATFEEAQQTAAVLAAYDLFQYEQNIKPDDASMTIIEVADADGNWCSLDEGETPDDIYHPFMVGTRVHIRGDYTPYYLAGRAGTVVARTGGGTDVELDDHIPPSLSSRRILLSDSDLVRL